MIDLPLKLVGTRWKHKETGNVATVTKFWQCGEEFEYEIDGPDFKDWYINDRIMSLKKLQELFERV